MLKKCTYCLLTFVLSFWSFGLMGQDTGNCFSLTLAEANAEMGDIVCIDLTTSGFNDILGMQWTVQYDDNLLNLSDIKNFGLPGLSATSFGTTDLPGYPGVIRAAWTDPTGTADGAGITLADDSRIVTFCFEVLGSTGVVHLDVVEAPTPIEVIDWNLNLLSISGISGGVTIGNTTPSALTIEDICISPSACSSPAIATVEVAINGGEVPFSYHWTGPGGFTSNTANLEANDPGYYTLVVTDQLGETAEGMVHLETPASGSIATGTISKAPCNDPNGGAIALNLVDETAQYTFNWSNGATTQNIDQLSAGTYTVTLTNSETGCQSVEVFELQTEEVIVAGTATCLSDTALELWALAFDFSNIPYTYQWSTGETYTGINEHKIVVDPATNANVTVTDSHGCSAVVEFFPPDCTNVEPVLEEFDYDCLSFIIGETTATTGETVCVDVITQNFKNVISFQNTIQWDPSLLSLIEVRNFEIGSVSSTFGVTAEQLALGRLTASWLDATLDGLTQGDNEVLYSLCFEVIGAAGFAEINFGEQPTPLEVTVESNDVFGLAPLPAAAIGGGINIGTSDLSSLKIEDICVLASNCSSSGLASMTVSVSGGSPGYSYSWTGPGDFSASTPTIVVDEKGFYALVVTDQNGAMAKAVASVEEGAGSSDFVNGTVTNVNCGTENSGAISLNLTEAGNFTYHWSNGATSQNLSNLSAGEYTVTATNSATGCIAVKTFQVSTSQIQAGVFYTCLDAANQETGMAEVAAAVFSGGTGPFTFSWSTGEVTTAERTHKIQVQLPATVSVTITDQSACTFVSQSISPICEGNQEEGEFALSYSHSCLDNGATTDLTAFVWNGGTAPFTFHWSTGVQETQNEKSTIRVSTAGTYSLTVTDATGLIQVLGGITPNCSATDNTPLHLSVGEANATTGETVCLAIRADGFNSLLGMQYAIGWDPALVQLTTVQSFNLPNLSNTSFNLQPSQLEDGILRLSWFDAQTIGVTMPDGAALYEMCFTVLGTEGEASIYFDQNSMITEFVNDGVSTAPPVLNNGLIIINGDERVWPGDTDHNALANHYDLLNIGIAYNATGPQRPNANLTWTGQWATDWAGQTPASAINYKHIDANGDGLISAADTNGLSLNWGQMVNFHNDPFDEFRAIPGQPKNLTAPIFVEPYPVASGDLAHFNIHLGDIENPVEGAYGIAFTIVYDPLAVVYGSAKASFQPSWLGNIGDNMIAIVRDDPNHHRIHLALTRIDQINVNGSGPIGMLSMTIEDVIFRDTEYEMSFRIENVRLISAQEQVIIVDQRETTGVVNDSPLGIDELPAAERIKLFPNPTTNQIQIEYNGIAAEYLQLFSPEGKLLREYKAMNQISLAGLPASTYLLRFVGKDGVYHKKVVKQ